MMNRYTFIDHNCAPMQYCLTPARTFLSIHLPVVPNPYAKNLPTIHVHKIHHPILEDFLFILLF